MTKIDKGTRKKHTSNNACFPTSTLLPPRATPEVGVYHHQTREERKQA